MRNYPLPVCRDKGSSLEVADVLDPARGAKEDKQ